ncbi:hypothetical protein V6N11_033111 [Hibiscus sabdariffa]|uniref:Uncharacterized protein n=1 Tax=Hibiscus sabdariffa TaxID=183260 RepID=A0ABR2A0Z1_9ROSI
MEMIDNLKSLLRFINLTLACNCKCRREAFFCRLFFTGKEPTLLHNLYHLAALCFRHINWLFIVYGQDYGAAFTEIFLSLPRILGNDPSVSSAWSVMATASKIWELERMLISLAVEPVPSSAEIRNERRTAFMAWYLIMCYLAMHAYGSKSISNKSGS